MKGTMFYEAKDDTCKHCGCAPGTHIQHRDAKPPHCTASNWPELYELHTNGHVFKAPTIADIQYSACDRCGEQHGARFTRGCQGTKRS